MNNTLFAAAPRPRPIRYPVLAADGYGPGDPKAVRAAGDSRTADRDRSAAVPDRRRPARSWPLLILALPAAVAVWSGWVGIGQMTGFGQMHPLPGIWNSFHLNTAVTLPVGVEAYAAYALHAWLATSLPVSGRTRQFAKWSAIASLLLGMAGQVAYHLLTEAGARHAPWGITTSVSCLPVLVLGMGTALAHMVRADASVGGRNRQAADDAAGDPAGQAAACTDRVSADRVGADRGCADRSVSPGGSGPAACTDQSAQSAETRTTDPSDWAGAGTSRVRSPSPESRPQDRRHGRGQPGTARLATARATARELDSTGMRVSRRTLRNAGLRGSNADLGALAQVVSHELAAKSRRPSYS
jgi:hypothetical protein